MIQTNETKNCFATKFSFHNKPPRVVDLQKVHRRHQQLILKNTHTKNNFAQQNSLAK